VAWSMMGAGLLFVMQLHMSWVLLVPYVFAALIAVALTEKRPQAIASAVGAFAAGAAIPGILLVPTILRFGWNAGHVEGAVAFHQQSLFEFVTTAARPVHRIRAGRIPGRPSIEGTHASDEDRAPDVRRHSAWSRYAAAAAVPLGGSSSCSSRGLCSARLARTREPSLERS